MTARAVQFAGATHRYEGSDAVSVDALDLEIGEGEFLVLVGPSGSGKSTSLRMLAGLERVESGRIRIGDRDVTNVPARDRDVAMVFQNYALYPNMTVAENMSFALKNAKVPKAERDARVLEAARMLELDGLLGRKPARLSGGQRQRVAMGRAIVRRPSVFCMDEPLSNLDAKLRIGTRAQIAELQRRLGVTTVYVTHDQVEAMTMGDRVAVLKDGVLHQVATPRELYDRPVDTFVAGFVGAPGMNLIECAVVGGVARVGTLGIPVPRSIDGAGEVVVGVRPEDWILVGAGAEDALAAVVELVEELGAESFVHVRGPNGRIAVRVDRARHVTAGETVHLRTAPERVSWFSAETGLRLVSEFSV